MLLAARDQFAAVRYDQASVRSIARQAGIGPAMVMRYYGNKEKRVPDGGRHQTYSSVVLALLTA
ncbi:TetR family transcriptional regulator [Kibdelosporangium lantanae]|uniref:TetR family transcriptional regulator n=1 Tax=Kibdelosporangium lantanae TaxID=1497396 RepID=A0ABW3M106_9PSEU